MLLVKWLMFICIGLPTQIGMYIIYPFLYVAWRAFVFEYKPNKIKPQHDFNVQADLGSNTKYDGALLDNVDNHGAFTMYGFIQKPGLEILQKDGSVVRRIEEDGSLDREAVSGDTIVAWFFANLLAKEKVSDETLLKVVDSYMLNLGTLSYDSYGDGYVSARCANFGINIANDSEFLKLTQPAAGPQFYTTSAVLASAYNKGFKYKLMFWTHWVVMGGWYWSFAPVLYTKENTLAYVRDITMKSLYIHLQVFGPRWWITKPMKFITDDISTHENDLFNAMMKRELNPLPPSMNPFFSQRIDASSIQHDMSNRMSPYIAEALKKIKEESKFE